jgi:death on curing protein
LIHQAALLALGVSRAQAFAQGNERTAFITADTFLRANGRISCGDPLDMARRLTPVADRAGTLEKATTLFAAWLRGQVDEKGAGGETGPE